jgi:hypothetical protein
MSGSLKKSNSKRLERIVLQARNRGAAAERRRIRQEKEQHELDHGSEVDREQRLYDDE